MEDFAVTCPLVPAVPHLRSGSCTSPRAFGLGFLQTPPRDDALALLLTLGSTNTWYGDSHPVSYVPCPAHTHVSVEKQRMNQEKKCECLLTEKPRKYIGFFHCKQLLSAILLPKKSPQWFVWLFSICLITCFIGPKFVNKCVENKFITKFSPGKMKMCDALLELT